MPVAGGGFEQAHHAQAAVESASMRGGGDDAEPSAQRQERGAAHARTVRLSKGLSKADRLLADRGYFSGQDVAACEPSGIEPLIALGREGPHRGWRDRFSEPDAPVSEQSPVARMAHRLKTNAGRGIYALRKPTVEPMLGILKSVLGFRQFLLRGLSWVRGEWWLAWRGI